MAYLKLLTPTEKLQCVEQALNKSKDPVITKEMTHQVSLSLNTSPSSRWDKLSAETSVMSAISTFTQSATPKGVYVWFNDTCMALCLYDKETSQFLVKNYLTDETFHGKTPEELIISSKVPGLQGKFTIYRLSPEEKKEEEEEEEKELPPAPQPVAKKAKTTTTSKKKTLATPVLAPDNTLPVNGDSTV